MSRTYVMTFGILTVLATTGAAGAADGGDESVSKYDPLNPGDVSIMSYTRTCTHTGITAISGACNYGPAYITDDLLKPVFILPSLAFGNSHMNLKERTPLAQDYVTFYDRTCASALPATTDASYQCFGGWYRSWHTNEYHTFFGEHSWTCLSVLHCTATVRAEYS